MGTGALLWILAGIGALATLALFPLSALAGRGVDPVRDYDYVAMGVYYATGLFAFLRRPSHRAVRLLLMLVVFFSIATAIGAALSFALMTGADMTWFWAGNALQQGIEIASLSALVALFALFPNGRYQRAYEAWVVGACWLLVPVVPLLLLIVLPTVHINSNVYWISPTVASPLHAPALGWIEPVALALYNGRLLLMLLAVGCWQRAIAGLAGSSASRSSGRSSPGWLSVGRLRWA
jgi:hypothetical protein